MFDLAELRRLLDAFERSDWDEVHLVADGVEVHIATRNVGWSAPAAAAPAVSASAPAAATAPFVPAPASVTTAPDVTGPPAVAPAAPAAAAGDGAAPAAAAGGVATAAPAQVEGAHAVVSPSPGIFWRSPAPGEPPFVDVGQRVTPETPIGIVEVMKLMNQVLAGVTGTVRAVLPENGGTVQRDEPLVLIEPDA
jgi:acetyl-CoA carboxylase biotin carboxyl carrier protein